VSTPQPAQQDYTPLLLEYLDVLQQQKKMYEDARQATKNGAGPAQTSVSASEAVYNTYKSLGMQFFRYTVETQLGLWRYFQYRHASNLAFSNAIFSCKSPVDILHSQASFLKQLIEDHANEGVRMMQSYFAYTPWAAPSHQR